MVEAAYVGNKGTRMWGGSPGSGYTDYNGLPSSHAGDGRYPERPGLRPPAVHCRTRRSTPSLSVAQALRPYPQYEQVNEQFPYNTNSNYNSLQVTVTRHLSKSLGFLAGVHLFEGPGLHRRQRAGCVLHVRAGLLQSQASTAPSPSSTRPQSFKLTWVYETPFGKGRRWNLGWANPILGGWQFAGIHNYQFRLPIQVSYSGYNIPAGFAPGIRPDVLSDNLTLGGAPTKTDLQRRYALSQPGSVRSPANHSERRAAEARHGATIPTERARPASNAGNTPHEQTVLHRRKEFVGVGATADNPFKRTSRNWLGLDIADPGSFGQSGAARRRPHRSSWRAA